MRCELPRTIEFFMISLLLFLIYTQQCGAFHQQECKLRDRKATIQKGKINHFTHCNISIDDKLAISGNEPTWRLFFFESIVSQTTAMPSHTIL